MPRPPALVALRFVSCPSWRVRALPVAVGLIALATMAAGISLVVVRTLSMRGDHILAPAGIALVLCSFLQWRAAWRLWNRRPASPNQTPPLSWELGRWFIVGAFVAYLATLAIGPAPYIEYGLLAAVAAWYTLLLLPLAASPDASKRWEQWLQTRTSRRAGWLAFASVATLVGAEASLQAYHRAGEWGLVFVERSAPIDGHDKGALVRQREAVIHGAAGLVAGPLRVAVLCDDLRAGSAGNQGYLARVEQALPEVKIVPFDLKRSWSERPSGEIAAQLSAERVDLVLAMLPVCEDLTRATTEPSWFDWRQFELARLAGAPAASDTAVPQSPSSVRDFESYCGQLAPQLAACRTPIDGRMHARWERTLQAVDDLVFDCRAADVAVALVLVPGEFQVNRALCETLARRAGYSAEQVDVELPQRKLACFAAPRQLPVVDLLPSLRLCRKSPYERNAETWNEAGHAAAATAIGGWLESRYGHQLGVSARLTSAP